MLKSMCDVIFIIKVFSVQMLPIQANSLYIYIRRLSNRIQDIVCQQHRWAALSPDYNSVNLATHEQVLLENQ